MWTQTLHDDAVNISTYCINLTINVDNNNNSEVSAWPMCGCGSDADGVMLSQITTSQ